MAEHSLTYHSSSIFYRSLGKGRPVLLIHGFGESGNVWHGQVDALKDHCRLLIPDLPGSGRSATIEDMSMEGMADVIKAVMDKEGVDTAAMIGHSMGGYITLAFAEKYPACLSSFGFVHSTAFADSEEKKATRRKAMEFIKKNGAYEFLRTSIPDLFYKGHASPHPYMAELIEEGKSFAPGTLAAYYQAMIDRPDRTHILKNFTGPILYIIGEHDRAIPFDQSLQQCYLPGQPHVHILRFSAHMGMVEEKDKVNAALTTFLSLPIL